MEGAGFLHWTGEFEGLAGSDGCKIQKGGGSHQLLLLLSKNDHITPKWQSCIRRIGFHLASNHRSAVPGWTCYVFCPCLASVAPQCLSSFLFPFFFPFPFIMQTLLLDEYGYHCTNSIYFKVSLLETFMCWLFSYCMFFLLEMGLNSAYEAKYFWTLHFLFLCCHF